MHFLFSKNEFPFSELHIYIYEPFAKGYNFWHVAVKFVFRNNNTTNG